MSGYLLELKNAIAPLMPGIVFGALLVLVVLGLRLLMRREAGVEKLRLPSTLLTLYFVTIGLVVAAKLYWSQVAGVLLLVSVVILASAAVFSAFFGLFDFFLGRYREVRVPRIIRDLLLLIIYVITIVIVLGQQGFDLTGIITTSAVVTAVIGFSLQDLLSNIASGLALELERSFKVGDWVKFGEQEGEILEVSWRSTKIQTLHNDIVVVPNNVITKSPLINMSVPTPLHRRRLNIGLRYEAPPNKAKESILSAVRGVEGVLAEPAPFVLLKSYDDFSIAYRVHFYIDQLKAKERIEDRVFTRLWYQLKRDGLSIPFPIRDINMRQVDAAAEQHQRARDLAETRGILRGVPFFEPLSAEEIDRLAEGTRTEFYAAGEQIIQQGDQGDSFYLIAAGEVDVLLGEERAKVASLHDGDHFGEMSLMTGEPRSATVLAQRDTRCYVIGKRIFSQVLEANPTLVEKVATKLAERKAALSDLEQADAQAAKNEHVKAEQRNVVSRIRHFFRLK